MSFYNYKMLLYLLLQRGVNYLRFLSIFQSSNMFFIIITENVVANTYLAFLSLTQTVVFFKKYFILLFYIFLFKRIIDGRRARFWCYILFAFLDRRLLTLTHMRCCGNRGLARHIADDWSQTKRYWNVLNGYFLLHHHVDSDNMYLVSTQVRVKRFCLKIRRRTISADYYKYFHTVLKKIYWKVS